MRSNARIGLATAVPLALALVVAARAGAQTATDGVTEPAESGRPGLWQLGPFYVTPKLRIGTIGLDTNVFYTPTDRRTDFTASGGPGLEILLPLRAVRFLVEGGANYVYFARTESQRRFGGDGRARLEWRGSRIRMGVEEGYSRTYQRPSFEVDQRVLLESWTTRGDLLLQMPPRLGVRAAVVAVTADALENASFLGADLARALTYDEYRAILGLLFRLTPKTSLVVEGDEQMDRFTRDPTRDADSNRINGGFEIASQTRLSGRAVGGIRLLRPKDAARGPGFQTPFADVNLSYALGPKTHVSALYSRDLAFSVFSPAPGAVPALTNETYGGRIEQTLVGRLDLQLFASYTRLVTRGAITVPTAAGISVTAVRDDSVRQGGADLGYRFRNHIRIGVAAVYTSRRSTFADFGIEGLLLGGTVRYTPSAL